MARRSHKKKSRMRQTKSTNNFLADFLRWLDKTPEAKKDFEDFKNKHKLDDYFSDYYNQKDYVGRPVTVEAEIVGFMGIRERFETIKHRILSPEEQDRLDQIERAYGMD